MWNNIKEWILGIETMVFVIGAFVLYALGLMAKYLAGLSMPLIPTAIALIAAFGLFAYTSLKLSYYPKGAKHRYKSYYLLHIASSLVMLTSLNYLFN